MARTVDPRRHQQRRLHLIDAALTCFARDGYHGATTTAICRQAGVSSGTFFHYFPTKAAVLLAILALGTGETRAWFADRQDSAEPLSVLHEFIRWQAGELADPRLAGFVRAVAAVLDQSEVSKALRADAEAMTAGLTEWVGRAQQAGRVRTDLPPRRLAAWLLILLDGFTDRIATDPSFSAELETSVLLDAASRLLAESQ